jgi:hypothetical protein
MAVRDEQTERLRVRLYRRMTPEERILIAAQLFEDGVAIVRGSILDQNPAIGPEELSERIRERVLPRGLARQVRQATRRRNAA